MGTNIERNGMGIFSFFKPKQKTIDNKTGCIVSVSVHEPTQEDIRKQQYDHVHEVKELQKNSFPSRNGLLPHEILMLSYAHKYFVGQTDFQQFWYYKYAVDDPGRLLESLKERGFIREATAKESLSTLTVPELKAIIADENLKATGKKAELISFISENISENVLEKKVVSRNYVLTDLGNAELQENQYVLYMHNYKYGNISVWDINRQMQGYPHNLWRDRVWGELNRLYNETITYSSNGNWTQAVAIRHQQSDFLMEEDRYMSALELLVDALHKELNLIAVDRFNLEIELRVNGIKSGEAPSYAEIVSDCHDYSFFQIKKVLEKAEIEKSEIAFRISGMYEHLKLKDLLLSKNEFVDLIIAKIGDKDAEFITICNKAQKILMNGWNHNKR